MPAVKTLFLEYAQSLDFSLCFQGFDDEIASLPGKYGKPAGCIWLALEGDSALAGCVAIRPVGGQDAEMKRLYVRPAYRGRALGKRLAEETVAFARAAGYGALRLDTIAKTMAAAEGMYRAMGFVETPPYYDNPVAGATFYALDLKG
jgi:ribosomal protein S18 acetylase RimI-like enzyme